MELFKAGVFAEQTSHRELWLCRAAVGIDRPSSRDHVKTFHLGTHPGARASTSLFAWLISYNCSKLGDCLSLFGCYIRRLIMTVMETIMRDIQSLPLREQVQVARYVRLLSASARRKRATVLCKTYGSPDDADGRAFEEAVAESRKMEPHG